jgi:predicted SnoaL-like aldol condensation-catalyzing enzyme
MRRRHHHREAKKMKTRELSTAVARRAVDEIWNQHNLDAIDLLFAPNYVTHDLGVAPGREDLKGMVSQAIAAAPGARVSIDQVLAKGDKVAMRYTASNGHQATGAPEPGQPATVTGALVLRVVHGQVREGWGAGRMVELLHRVGNGSA